MDHIVLDVEIAKSVGQDGIGWNDTDKMGIACVCLWEYKTARMRVYGAGDVEALKERIMKADRITGYNIWKFDLPIIYGMPSDQWWSTGWMQFSQSLKSRADDLLQRIWSAVLSRGGYSLKNVAYSCLRTTKIDNGVNAPVLFQNGDLAKVVNYCADDVALTRDLSDYIDRYGGIRCPNTDRFIQILQWCNNG